MACTGARAIATDPDTWRDDVQHSSIYDIVNLSVALVHSPGARVFTSQLFDHQSILVSPTQFNELDNDQRYVVDPPREIGCDSVIHSERQS